MSQKRYHPTLKLKDHFAHVLLHAPELITYHPKTPGRTTPSARASPARASRAAPARADTARLLRLDVAKTLQDIPTQLTARKVIDDVLAHREPRIEDLEKLQHYVV
jgi:hypothetical protein